MPSIPVVGEIRLVDGVLQFWHRDKGLCGEMYVGPQGAVFEQIVGKGEFTMLQVNDPPSLKMASLPNANSDDRMKLGQISFNVMRPDGICENLAFISGATAEDSNFKANDLRGQIEVFIRPDTDIDAQQAMVITTAYAEDLSDGGIDPRTLRRKIWTGVRNMLTNLWKFE